MDVSEIWQQFIQSQLKQESKIGKVFSKAGFGGYEDKILTLWFSNAEEEKSAKGLIDKLKQQLPSGLKPCDRVNTEVGIVPQNNLTSVSDTSHPNQRNSSRDRPRQNNINTGGDRPRFNDRNNDRNNTTARRVIQPVSQPLTSNNPTPLTVLNIEQPMFYEAASSASLLKRAAIADESCQDIYKKLRARTESIVGKKGITFAIDFNWRLRVGGTRGFSELLLPVFHPVFGIPYIPASTLKGAARSWARRNGKTDFEDILGTLHGNSAKAGKVEFLDAFPDNNYLSVDVANPQWKWNNNGTAVIYKPEPHPLLTLESPKVLIGLLPTSTGTKGDVDKVKVWLENALAEGIGSRVSAGYGQALNSATPATSGLSQSFEFSFWTEGIYGVEPPSKENNYQGEVEFRPTAIRGIMRYWFRAIALSLYTPSDAKILEEELFGKLSQQGKISLHTQVNPPRSRNPYHYGGRIYITATDSKYLEVAKNILILASHLGGFGRGSRRPLHKLNGRMRGCHWEVQFPNLPLECDRTQWQNFWQKLTTYFQDIKSPLGRYNSDPGAPNPHPRQQDTLDKNAEIWLMRSPNLIHPQNVTNWQEQGNQPDVLGKALELLYDNPNFKGVSRNNGVVTGNKFVGGNLGTPSFVWIKSIFPASGDPYQVVTLFGKNNPDRNRFSQELNRRNALNVFS